MSLSPEDFQRIQVREISYKLKIVSYQYLITTPMFQFQTNLLELKNQNYSLEDQCRKQKNGK